MLVIPLTILIVFKYVPMYGLQIAFKNYRITSTIEKAPWVGLKHFRKFVTYYNFWPIIRNSYFDAMIYLTDKSKLPLQNILREILIVNSVSNDVSDAAAEAAAQTRAELLKYAVIVVATLPMMLVYPFVQKFFVQGVMLGSVKG